MFSALHYKAMYVYLFVDMALSPRDEAEFKQRSAQKLKVTTDPVERLRLACLSRGAHGIKGLGR